MAGFFYQDGFDIKEGKIEIPPTNRPDFRSCYVFAFVKSGSTLVNSMVGALFHDCGIPVIDIPSRLYADGIPNEYVICDSIHMFRDNGFLYTGFRSMPFYMTGMVSRIAGRKFLVVRDPRDMLVSLYYSMKYSHEMEERGTPHFNFNVRTARQDTEMKIDDFCLFYSGYYNIEFMRYSELREDAETLVLRYEDFIYDKDTLLRSICDWFSIDIPLPRLAAIAKQFDQIPSQDKPMEHVRQVHPGDHKRKLQPRTIETLNAALPQFLAAFNYEI